MRFIVVDVCKNSEPFSKVIKSVKGRGDISVVFEIFDKGFNPRFVIGGIRSSIAEKLGKK